jgi:glycosyltransferase involved in cell wall biosynthesis
MMEFRVPRILVFSDWFLPGFRGGGPIRSLANLVELVDAEFDIVTRSTDLHSDVPYPDIQEGVWIPWNQRTRVMYLSEQHMQPGRIRMLLQDREYDWFYLNSLFSPRFTLMPLQVLRDRGWSQKVILAPRGMLKPGALSVKSWKKKVFLFIASRTNHFGFRGIRWHATNEAEGHEIQSAFGTVQVSVAPNLPHIPAQPISHPPKPEGELRLVCIARVSPEKGMLEGIRFLRDAGLGKGVTLDIYGTRQNVAYLQSCEEMARQVAGAHISFHGELEPALISGVLSEAHFFYLATWGENYGHAIIEALLHGVPVIISDRTPWKNLYDASAGWSLPLDTSAFTAVLRQAASLNGTAYAALCAGAFSYGSGHALNPAALAASQRLFALHGGGQEDI